MEAPRDISEVSSLSDSIHPPPENKSFLHKSNDYLRSLSPKSYDWIKTFIKFIGPGYMVAVGYLDPGNWATDLSAGSQFGYDLLFIILLSNIMAVLLQSLCVKLGVVTGLDLAQSCRKHYSSYVNWVLYIFCELAIIATDLAEVIGSAIALNLLFGLPTIWGVVITAADVLIILLGWNTKHIRAFEIFIITLVYASAISLLILVGKSGPDWSQVAYGFVPKASVFTNPEKLYVAMGIIGATVMPHNLYLHSSLVKYRAGISGGPVGDIAEVNDDTASSADLFAESSRNARMHVGKTLQFSYIDSIFALSFALIANSSILIVSAAAFFHQGIHEVAELSDAYYLLDQYLGKAAAVLFAFALLCAGQSSTITGTLAGQYVMTGFLGNTIQIQPWVRRLVTRVIAIVPALVIVLLFGDSGLNQLLVFSQVILSLQLPFAVWPLVHFTSSKGVMTIRIAKEVAVNEPSVPDREGASNSTPADPTPVEDQVTLASFQNSVHFTIIMVLVALLITIFNIVLLIEISKTGIH